MYYCDECNNFFDEPVEVVYEVHTELSGAPREYRPGCPKCKSPNIDEAYVCDKCGQYVSASEACFDGDKVFCESCVNEFEEDEEEHQNFDVFAELDDIFARAFERGVSYG